MKLTKKLKKLLLMLGILLLIGIGEHFGLLEFELGSPAISQQDWVDHADSYENITGKILVGPVDVWEYFERTIPQTTKILYLQTYDFTEKRVKAIFRELLAKGVEIKMIMENKKYRQYKDTFVQVGDDFADFDNFQLKSDYQMKTKYVHSKITLLDDSFWIQTANLTHSSFFSNREYFFVSSHIGVYASLKTIFEKDWVGEEILLEDIHPNLLVCNINCRPVIENLLSSAEESLEIQTQYISDDNILKILRDKAGDGNFEMHLLLADTSGNEDLVDYFGRDKVQLQKKPYNHSKMILIDGETLILGSMNFSSNSLDNNREIGIILLDQKLIDRFLEQFWEDWK